MPNQPLVVVALLTYNRPAGLRDMLESLLAQTYSNLKIVVFDNASTDPGTAKVCEEYRRKDARVMIERNPENLGMTGNFKHAYFQTASLGADYFMWAPDDDVYLPEFVEESMRLLQVHPQANAAMPSADMTNADGVVIYRYPGFSRFNNLGLRKGSLGNFAYLWWLMWDPIVNVKGTLPYMVFRRSSMDKMMARMLSNQFSLWNGDIASLFLYLKENTIVCSDKVLMLKSFPTRRDHYWFPLRWSYQPLPQNIPSSYRMFMRSCDTRAERMLVWAYIGCLCLFWMTIGYPGRGTSWLLRKLDDRLRLVPRVSEETPRVESMARNSAA